MLGFIRYKKRTLNDVEGAILRSRLKAVRNKPEEIEFDVDSKHKACSICLLPNDRLIVSHFSYGVTITDKFLNEILHEVSVEGRSTIISIATNNHDKIYLASLNSHEVICTDLNLKLIKVIGNGGRHIEQISYPTCVFYYKGLVYICDHRNERIQVFTEDLTYKSTLKLSFKPNQICIANDLMAIKAAIKYEPKLFFYTLEPCFKQKYAYEIKDCNLSVVNSNFYAYCNDGKILYCYNDIGELVESIHVKFLDNLKSYKNEYEEQLDGFIFNIDDVFLISNYESSSMHKF